MIKFGRQRRFIVQLDRLFNPHLCLIGGRVCSRGLETGLKLLYHNVDRTRPRNPKIRVIVLALKTVP